MQKTCLFAIVLVGLLSLTACSVSFKLGPESTEPSSGPSSAAPSVGSEQRSALPSNSNILHPATPNEPNVGQPISPPSTDAAGGNGTSSPEGISMVIAEAGKGSSCKLSVTNSGARSVTLDLHSLSVNGWSVGGTAYGTVAAGATDEIWLYADADDLARAGVSSIDNIRANFMISEDGAAIGTRKFHFGDETVSPMSITGTEVSWGFDKGGIKVSNPLYLYDNATQRYTVLCVIENSFGEDIVGTIGSPKVNDSYASYSASATIQDGTSGILVLKHNSGDDPLAAGLVDNIAFTVSLSDSEDFSAIDSIDFKMP